MISPYTISLVFCTLTALYLLLASRTRFLPYSPLFFSDFLMNYAHWVFKGSVLAFISLSAYSFLLAVSKAEASLMQSAIEYCVFNQFQAQNEALENLFVLHKQLEEALLESNQSVVQSNTNNEVPLTTVKESTPQKKALSFALWNNEVEKFAKLDSELSKKTDPWLTKLENITAKSKTEDGKTIFYTVKSEQAIEEEFKKYDGSKT